MPELPEVETSRRGIAPWLKNQRVNDVVVRDRRLRWPIPDELEANLAGQTIRSIRRRAKYLFLDTDAGSAMLHLGMSGSLRIIESDEPAGKHDHVDIRLTSGKALRFRDPRRFGCWLWARTPEEHPLIRDLGPEPLSDAFTSEYLWRASRGRRVAVKQLVMNANIVVGVGNIYANEALYLAGIHPKRRSDRIAVHRMPRLVDAIKTVLTRAIDAGGTTLRDFHGGDGEPGYFKQELNVYARDGQPCPACKRPLSAIVLGQRSTFYCKNCQR
ncbi:MAG: bifunctional DNA-formamidopyrimidine glycosylase/DNA-(apurinic or apyrimidinic site) lyase [Gammaproteobacteria bacterium]|nr:bifunctional DNA-formamidopyrimidine glycosylase/DNA-(apurinic or apyrimidinic site) lyase [Gammaproteobacteria bacterium]